LYKPVKNGSEYVMVTLKGMGCCIYSPILVWAIFLSLLLALIAQTVGRSAKKDDTPLTHERRRIDA
jgi:hypothetical protein